MKIQYIERTDSTNDHILKIDEDMALVYCDYQSKGRGQRGNSWESEPNANLTFSFMLKPQQMSADKQFIVSKMVAIALVNTLAEFSIEAKIKWPNDIYVGDLKISGILIENRLSAGGMLTKIICGVGLNVNQQQFLSNAPNPVSMSQLAKKEFSREKVLEQFCSHFERLYTLDNIAQSAGIDSSYWELLYRANQWHDYVDNNGRFTGKIVGIGNYGELIIQSKEHPEHLKSYMFKDVSYVI